MRYGKNPDQTAGMFKLICIRLCGPYQYFLWYGMGTFWLLLAIELNSGRLGMVAQLGACLLEMQVAQSLILRSCTIFYREITSSSADSRIVVVG